MTATGDFIPADDNQALEGPAYPSVFGVQLTPKVQAILLALVGLVGAFFLYNYLVKPVQEQKNTLEQQVADKEVQVQQQQASLQKVAELEAQLGQALDQRVGIYGLLGDRKSLDTLLLDLNQQIENSNATVGNAIRTDFNNTSEAQLAALGLNRQQIAQVRNKFASDPVLQRAFYTSELARFNPSQPTAINDSSFGPELNGKLERYSVDISMRALYPQTLNILRNIERLEPLVIIRDFRQGTADYEGLEEEDFRGFSRPLQSEFTLDVLVPTGDPSVPPPPAPPPSPAGEGGQPAPAEGGQPAP